MQGEKPFRERYKWWLKGVSLICGLLLIGLGGESFGTLSMRSPTDLILPIYYMYSLPSGFAFFIISAEFGLKCILQYFRFIEGFAGRGLFYIL